MKETYSVYSYRCPVTGEIKEMTPSAFVAATAWVLPTEDSEVDRHDARLTGARGYEYDSRRRNWAAEGTR